MKKLLLGLMMLLAFGVFAQSTHTVDFEPAGVGADWIWIVGENADNPPLEFVANPFIGGINTSATTAKFTARLTGNPWALCFTDSDGQFTFDAANSTITMMVYKPVISDVGFKVEGGTGTPTQIVVANTMINTWEELTFDFSAVEGQTFSRLVIIPDFDFTPRTQENIVYFDNIQVPDGVPVGPLPEPTVAAPTPVQDPGDVISMFSDAYTDVPVDTWLTVWSQGALEDVLIAGNATKKYTSVNFVGVETTGANLIDASAMTHFHIDVWSPDANDFKVKLVDFGADGAFGGGDDSEHEITFPAPATETWISYDIPLTDFTGLASTMHLAQLIMVKAPLGTLFVDNVFYYISIATEPTVAAPTPTQDPAYVISMFSDAYTDVPVDTWLTVWSVGVLDDIFIAGNATKKYSAMDFVGVETVGPNLINATAMTHFHLDMWTPDANDFKIKLVDFGADGGFGGGDDTEHEIVFANPATGIWNSYDIPFTDFVNLTNREHLAQLIMVKAPQGTIFVDNVFYYTLPPTEPTVAAPTPTQDPANVISMFSDAYTDVPVDTWLTVWSVGVLDDIFIAGNATKKYSAMDFVGVETVGPNLINATAMTHFHLDMWTPDANDFKIKLVDFGADGGFGGGDDTEHEIVFANPATGIWNSYDIPFTDFVNLTNREHLAQLIMVKAPQGTIFVDNVFYYVETVLPTVWNGSNDNDWHNGLNWDNGVPGATTDVTIPAGLTNYPTISSAAVCNNISFGSDGSGAATLLDNGFLTVNGTATVDRYFTGNTTDWHLVSSPISNAIAGVFTGMYLQSFDETTNSYTEISDENMPLDAGSGYAVYSTLGIPNTVTFSGVMNNGTQQQDFTANNQGWNLMGNPFVSSIDWESVTIPVGMSNEVHYIDAASGNDLSYVQGVGGAGSQFVPPMQGFFVKATGAGTLTLDDMARSHAGAGSFYKDYNPNLLVLEASNGIYSDQAWVHFNDLAGIEHDGTYDAYKRISITNPTLPQLFSITPNGSYLSINGMPEVDVTLLGFTAVESGEYTISAIESGEFTNVYLVDLFNNSTANLLAESYTFNYLAGDPVERFELHFESLSIDNNILDNISIYSFGNDIHVNLPENSHGQMSVYNAMGQEIITSSLNEAHNIVNLKESGFYIVSVSIEGRNVSEKIVIK